MRSPCNETGAPKPLPSAFKQHVIEVANLIRASSTVASLREVKSTDLYETEIGDPTLMAGVFLINPGTSSSHSATWWASLDQNTQGRRWELTRRTEINHKFADSGQEVVINMLVFRLIRLKLGVKDHCGFVREKVSVHGLPKRADGLTPMYIRQRRPRRYKHVADDLPLTTPDSVLAIETFEILFQTPAAPSEEWLAFWHESASIDLWTCSQVQSDQWLQYLRAILTSLAGWMGSVGGVYRLQLLTQERLRVPLLVAYPQRFQIFEHDRQRINEIVTLLASRPYSRLSLPKRYVFNSTITSMPHWTGGSFEGHISGITGLGSLHVFDHTFIGSVMYDVAHGSGQLHRYDAQKRVTRILSGVFHFGNLHGEGEECSFDDTGSAVTRGVWQHGSLQVVTYCQVQPANLNFITPPQQISQFSPTPSAPPPSSVGPLSANYTYNFLTNAFVPPSQAQQIQTPAGVAQPNNDQQQPQTLTAQSGNLSSSSLFSSRRNNDNYPPEISSPLPPLSNLSSPSILSAPTSTTSASNSTSDLSALFRPSEGNEPPSSSSGVIETLASGKV